MRTHAATIAEPNPLSAARATAGAGYCAALAVVALLDSHPVLLAADLAVVLLAAIACGVGAALRRAAVVCLVLGLPIVVVNVLVSRQGLTVFWRLGDLGPFGQGDLTVEALVAGLVIALQVAIPVLAGALLGACVNADELLRAARRRSSRTALTATLTLRLIPVLLADAARIAEAQRTRPGTPAVGRMARTRLRVSLLRAVVDRALDRAFDVAATLEVRGFALGGRPQRSRRPRSRHDRAVALTATALIALAIVGRVAGVGGYTAYPRTEIGLGAGTLALCAGVLALGVLPLLDRRGIAR